MGQSRINVPPSTGGAPNGATDPRTSTPRTAEPRHASAQLSRGNSRDSVRTLTNTGVVDDKTQKHQPGGSKKSDNRPEDLEKGEAAKVPLSDTPVKKKKQTSSVVTKAPKDGMTRPDAPPANNKQEMQGETKKPDPFLVTLQGRETINPHTWRNGYRWLLTMLGGLSVLNATFASTTPSQVIFAIDSHFGVSEEVGLLTLSLFVAGYCVGPLLWG